MTDMHSEEKCHWIEQSRFVIDGINEIKSEVKEVQRTQVQVLQDIASVKAKSKVWGGVFGTIAASIIGAIIWISKTKLF